jgi:hypothetical protein
MHGRDHPPIRKEPRIVALFQNILPLRQLAYRGLDPIERSANTEPEFIPFTRALPKGRAVSPPTARPCHFSRDNP